MNGVSTAQRSAALDEAAEWLLRLQDDALADAELERWSRWMAASPHHAAAFDDLSALWDAAAGLDSDALRRARAANAVRRGRGARKRRTWVAAVAASVLLAAGVVGWLALRDRVVDAPLQVLATPVGERGQWALADGSVVELDAGSEAVVHYTLGQREVELRRGQAFFRVAPAAQRPFVVTADGVQSRALGTRFVVAHRGARQVAVTVAEGRVRVTAPPGGPGGTVHHDLVPDQQVVYSPATGLQPLRRVSAELATAWLDGTVVYQGEPLAQVIDDLNRHSRIPIRLQDPELGQLKVTGRWALSGIDRWLTGLASALQLEVQRRSDGILLARSGAWKNDARVAPAPGATLSTE